MFFPEDEEDDRIIDEFIAKQRGEQKVQRRAISTTQNRYADRDVMWQVKYLPLGKMLGQHQGVKNPGWWLHRFWWFIHNVPVHVLLGIFPCRATFRLHDWASRKLNAK